MAKTGPSSKGSAPSLFISAAKKHPKLFLPRILQEDAGKAPLDGPDFENAKAILLKWADLAEKGHLKKKETSLDAEFLQKIFGEALGYKSVTDDPNDYHRERQFTVPGEGFADGALGMFASGKPMKPTAVIELKGAETDLDHDKFDGRTPVKQVWDYLNQLPETKWGIVSNYVTIRLYHKDSPARAYEEFTFNDFRDEDRLRQFYFLFQRNNLVGGKVAKSRTDLLLKKTQTRQREVGDELYQDYSSERKRLITHLIDKHSKTQDEAIHIAQKILDRIIFVAFCEDRGLLRENTIERAYREIPPFSKVVNPRWQNFKGLFHAMDKGHEGEDIPPFNGGLFSAKTDDAVDSLELGDEWTTFFSRVGGYDFSEEVNVEVLGHLFEKSVTELEKFRVVGLFGKQEGGDGQPMMPKSAERKRFGIYYTPPQFTRLIVEQTLGPLIRDRVESIPDAKARIGALRNLRLVDPACGSGAFLIAAYDKFEEAYEDVVRAMRVEKLNEEADELQKQFPDFILCDNIFGMDLSRESVEISQLALWIRSARKGRTLANLSANIVCGNSLVDDPAIHNRAAKWPLLFGEVFNGPSAGFDAVVGNPPWERMKLQEREFFSLVRPDIASTANAADRKRLVAGIEEQDASLWERYQRAQADAEATLRHIRSSGNYPLTARGDINTYMLFSELARKIVAPTGRIGLLVPSGIATDDTTKHFFSDLMENSALVAMYDFVNRLGLFPDVEGRFKFCVLLMLGSAGRCPCADFVFFAETLEELSRKDRHVTLSNEDLKLLNPNTKTCPVFRTRKDADLTKAVYGRLAVFVDHNRRSGGNPWGIRFSRMFDQTNDADHFLTGDRLTAEGFRLHGNVWVKEGRRCLPLYEAKMTRDYDHRASKVSISSGNWYMNYAAVPASLVEHQNPEFAAVGRWWVYEDEVVTRTHASQRIAAISFHDVARATDQRTMVACYLPFAAVSNTLPLIVNAASVPWRRFCCLLGNLNSFAYDFVTRQKAGGSHLNFFVVEQLPTLPPDRYDDPCPWDKNTKLEDWVADRVLKLTCTAEDMVPLAEAAGLNPAPHKWKPEERERLRAELDAAFFVLYGIKQPEVEYILDQFQGVVNEDKAHGGLGQTRKLVLAALDVLVGS